MPFNCKINGGFDFENIQIYSMKKIKILECFHGTLKRYCDEKNSPGGCKGCDRFLSRGDYFYGCPKKECKINYCFDCYQDANDLEVLGFPADLNKTYDLYGSRTTEPYPNSNHHHHVLKMIIGISDKINCKSG
jgi:hypothetical protein